MTSPASAPAPVPELQVVVPMGGLGTRFRAVGVSTPKPLIDVAGVPMFARALGSFAAWPGPVRVVAVVRADDDAAHGLGNAVRAAAADLGVAADVVLLRHDTRGAVETVLVAAPLLDPDGPVVVMDCDIAFEAPAWFPAMLAAAAAPPGEGVDGLLLSFRSSRPRYSYAEVDDAGLVVRTAEKCPISEHALMGAYGFARAAVLLEHGSALVTEQISAAMPEYYVSLVYNRLLAAGLRVGLVSGDFYCFGTPEELAAHLATGAPVGPGD